VACASLIIVLPVQVILFDSVWQRSMVLTPCGYCFLSFSIAIWNRNIIVSFIAVGTWLASVALNIRGTSRIPTCSHYLSHISNLCLRRFNIGENIYICPRSTNRCSRRFKQARYDVQPHRRYLRYRTYKAWPRQCHWYSCGRYSAPPDHAGWGFATPAQEFDWHVGLSLPTGDTCSFFSGLRRKLTSN
jgi:hypothetical protein